MTIEEAIVARLRSVTAVTDLVALRIYPQHAPQTAALPYLVYATVSGGSVNAMDGPTTTFNRRLQIDCLAATYDLVKQLAGAVRGALNGWSQPTGPSVGSCMLQSEVDDLDEPISGAGSGVRRVIQDYSVWYSD